MGAGPSRCGHADSTGVFIDREEREVFFVVPELRAELVGELRSILILTAITRQGVLMLWPVPLPDESGRRNAWADTTREAAETAKQQWVRVVADMALGAYRMHLAGPPRPCMAGKEPGRAAKTCVQGAHYRQH
jgi:hypothetical protein